MIIIIMKKSKKIYKIIGYSIFLESYRSLPLLYVPASVNISILCPVHTL